MRQPALYASGMTRLDQDTLEWLIENIGNGPRYQEMTFRKNGEDHDFKYFFADDIRAYLAELQHLGTMHFLPEEALKSHEIEDLKRLEARCDCGWVEGFDLTHPHPTFDKDERELRAKHDAHVAEEVRKVEERFQWE